MKMKPLLLALLALVFHLLPVNSLAQNCIPTTLNGRVITIACPQTCTPVSYQVPHIKSTTDYLVQSIPYQPLLFTTPGGNEPTEIYVDDKFSHLLALPFPVCFYGGIYNSFVVGSNGVISFDASQADCSNDYRLDFGPATPGVPQPIPHIGTGTCSQTNVRKYPPLSIMGPYHDLNPNTTATTPDRKIEWRIEGTAPCRKLVVSFYQIALYGDINAINTAQIIVHESTGIVDVYMENKRLDQSGVPPWNADFAILGLQKDQTTAVAAAGKNCTVWTSDHEGYRFLPYGAGSRFLQAQLFTLSGTYVATADTTTTTPGVLDINFPSVCPPTGSNQYVVKTQFVSCSNPATILETLDTITLNLSNSLYATAVATNTDCGPPNGTITVTIPPGFGNPPYTWVLDGSPPVTGGSPHQFTAVAAGSHIVTITDASGQCSSSLNVTVNRNNNLLATTSTTPASCPEVFNGTINVRALNGFGPYSFQLDGLLPVSGSNPYTFTNVNSGAHQVIVYDATGCQSGIIAVTVVAGAGVNATVTSQAATCAAATNGTITINASGTAPFRYQLDGGIPVTGTASYTFTNVSAGPHTVVVLDANGCNRSFNITVNAGPEITALHTLNPTSCFGASNGSAVITPLNGLAPYSFAVNGQPPVAGTVPYTAGGLGMGTHIYQVFDAAGCSSDIYSFNILPGPALTTTVNKQNVLCNGDATGRIVVVPPAGGNPPFQYSLDRVTWQASTVFNGLLAGSYTVFFRSSNGCEGSQPVTITEPPALVAAPVVTPVRCQGEGNGMITVNAGGGTLPYSYSINGGTSWQGSGIFSVPAGNYTVLIRDVNGCIASRDVVMTEPLPLQAVAGTADASCDGGNDGRITVVPSGGNGGYRYSLDGINFQTSSTFFVAPGNYTAFVKDNLGCAYQFPVTVGLHVNLFLTPQPDAAMCEGSAVRLTTVSNAASYAWTPRAGLNDTTIANPLANPPTTSEYRLRAVLGRCEAFDTVNVIVHRAPLPDAGPDGDICYGQSYTLQGSGGTSYSWSPSAYLNSASGAHPISTPTLTTTYSLRVTDALGCPSLVTDEVKVNVRRTMTVTTFPYDTIVHPGDRFRILAVSPGIHYSWTPAAALDNPYIPNPVVTAGAAGTELYFQVVAEDQSGCKGEGYVKIRVYKGPDIFVPTGFTPDRNGTNDRFTPVPVGIAGYNYFRVFNRWGQLLFSTTRLHEGWDGRVGGREQPTGTYVWMIEGRTADGRLITKKGTVTLIR